MDTCPICQAQFKRHYRRGGIRQIYCSKKCRYATMYEECTCKTCGQPYRRNRVSKRSADYCSRQCIARHPCQLCGKMVTGRVKFQAYGATRVLRFCSRQCASVINFSSNGRKNYVVRGFAATIRRIGKIACERCGFDDPDGLTVHHVDRDRDNNQSSNLLTLCGTCHALEHNKGSRTRKRKIRIAELLAKHVDL